jgi:hypothetical protein
VTNSIWYLIFAWSVSSLLICTWKKTNCNFPEFCQILLSSSWEKKMTRTGWSELKVRGSETYLLLLNIFWGNSTKFGMKLYDYLGRKPKVKVNKGIAIFFCMTKGCSSPWCHCLFIHINIELFNSNAGTENIYILCACITIVKRHSIYICIFYHIFIVNYISCIIQVEDGSTWHFHEIRLFCYVLPSTQVYCNLYNWSPSVCVCVFIRTTNQLLTGKLSELILIKYLQKAFIMNTSQVRNWVSEVHCTWLHDKNLL